MNIMNFVLPLYGKRYWVQLFKIWYTEQPNLPFYRKVKKYTVVLTLISCVVFASLPLLSEKSW